MGVVFTLFIFAYLMFRVYSSALIIPRAHRSLTSADYVTVPLVLNLKSEFGCSIQVFQRLVRP